ncbi:macrophage mannose receptor 1-like isoform X2 [Haliotis cracherodii]|uniref:macrophage mannose receptor 1-like isoform X2 n=1 Tax=Haliotis cracherodii TaxID=6455 RepID=UPI0039EB13F2
MCIIFTFFGLLCISSIHIVSSQVCPYGWIDRPRGDSCYKIVINNIRDTWIGSRSQCQALQSTMYKLDSVQERDWLMKTLQNATSVFPDVTDWWSGVYNRGDGKGWLWAADDTPIDNSLIQWLGGTVPPNDGNKHCAIVNSQGYNSSSCVSWLRVICERPKSQPLVCDVDHDWVYNNGSCYKLITEKRTWSDASTHCQTYSARLSKIDGDTSQGFLSNMAKSKGSDLWIGLKTTQKQAGVTWTWDGGAPLVSSITYWATDNPGTIAKNERNSTCAIVDKGRRRKLSWVAINCEQLNNYVCQKPQGVCQDGWLQHQDSCFAFNPLFSLPWARAKKFCSDQGASLLSLKRASDQAFIQLYLKEQAGAGISSIWIGASDNNTSGPFQWVDATSIEGYKNWAPSNPVNKAGTQDCAYIDTTDISGLWQTSSDCSQLKSFVCMIPVNKQVFQITTPKPTFFCDDGWHDYGGNCFFFNNTDSTWIVASDTCQANMANLVVIPDEGTQAFVHSQATDADYWIGLQDRRKEGGWTWIDGKTPFSYSHWNKNEPNNLGNENCVAILGNWGADQNGKWNDYACSKPYSFICQKAAKNDPNRSTLAPTPKPVFSKKCGAYWEESSVSDYCYQFNTALLSWMDAREMCMHRGGQLASITSLSEQFYIAGRIRGISIVGLWIGANDRDSEGGWVWEDRAPFAYMNWVPGEPNDYGNSEDCGFVVTNNARWNDFNCQRRNGYICKKLGNIQATTVQPMTSPMTLPAGKFYGCQPGWKPYLNSCYLVVKTEVTWQAARTACRAAGGDLASVASKTENQFINSQIQKGFNDGVWIGFNDLKNTNSFVWTNGDVNKFTNWARNEPNNYQGHAEDCVVLYSNGAQWNDDSCDANHGYVCKASKQVTAATQQSPFSVGCSNVKGSLGYQHYCYQFNNIPLAWQASENMCKTRGGHLATINSYDVQSFISSELTKRDDVYWIGLTDVAHPGNYTWATGDKLLYTPWDKSHNGSERSTCVGMRTTLPTGLWQNLQCTVIKPYICQLPRQGFTPPPTTPTPTTSVPLPCASGWSGYESYCYKAFRMSSSQRKTWSEALVYCQGLSGSLASIHSKELENFLLTNLLRFYYNANFWVGLSDRSVEGSYVWADGTPFDYTNWYRGEPSNSGGNEDCVEFNEFTKQWNDNSCFIAKDFICEIPRGTTVPTTTIQTTTPIVACAGTDSGWDYHAGSCYFISPPWGADAKKSWYEARRYCMAKGGDLASIHDVGVNNFLTSLITKRSLGIYWIGLNQLGMDSYVWSDGSTSNYVNWKPGEPNDAYGGQLCVDIYGGVAAGPGLWNDDNCMDSNGYICKKFNGTTSTVTPPPTPTLAGGCPSGFSPLDNKCFSIGGRTPVDQKNWTEARDQCRLLGKNYDIASISSYIEQAFLLMLMKQVGITSTLWIGLNDQSTNGHYVWQDNTEVTYTNWNKGEPSDRYTYSHYNREDCVSVLSQQGVGLGRWNDEKCSEKKAFVCQTYKSTSYTTPTIQTTCKPGYQHFGTSCYRVVTSPATWQAGQTACQVDQGNLVSITDLYEQSFVDTIAHVNNVMSGFWIGLSDKKTPGIYGWYDGWPVLFTRWGKDEPTRNAMEGCVAQQSLTWNDTLCARSLPFICEISSTTPPPTTPIPPGFCPDRTWTAHGDSCYFAAPSERKSWPEANFLCREMGMELMTVHSQADLDFIKTLLETQLTTPKYSFSLYFNKPNVWLGLRKSQDGGFRWSDGTPANFFKWAPGEPSDVNGTNKENCVEYYRNSYAWNDVSCFNDRSYICQTKKTIPSTTPPSTTTTSTTTTTTTTTTPITTKLDTFKPNFNAGSSTQSTRIIPPPISRHEKLHTGAGQDLTGGQIAGILIGVAGLITIIIVIVFILRRRRAPPPSSPTSGFDNALYSKDAENVSMSNGTSKNSVYVSGVPSEEC